MVGFGYYACALWIQGYSEKAHIQSATALSLAQHLALSYTLARMLYYNTLLRQLRRNAQAIRDQADATLTVATAQRFAFMQAWDLSCVAGP